MGTSRATSSRIAVVGGGPAGSLFALYALKYARLAGRDVSITIYEGKDFRQSGQPGCNMCAGIIPASVLGQFGELDLAIPPEMILSHISSYSLHTSAGVLDATQPDPNAQIITVYRGAGPRVGRPLGLTGFDELLLEEAVSRGATLRRCFAQAVQRSRPVEVLSEGGSERYDLVVLATGVNAHSPSLPGFDYQPPPTGSMCQTELCLGRDEVERRLGSSVRIFLPPNEIAAYGILIPKGPYVTASLLKARDQMRSLRQFLGLAEVRAVLGDEVRGVCGCLPRISVGLARHIAHDDLVAVGDAAATRLYKNGIGSALATAERAAWTAIYRGHAKGDFARHYLPLCRAIELDNWIGRLLFLEVPVLKRFGTIAMAHRRLVTDARRHPAASELQARILWGMFTGAYSYRQIFRMAVSPSLVAQLLVTVGRSIPQRKAQV